MRRRRFTRDEQLHIDALVEKRLTRERRQLQAEHEGELSRVRAACRRDLDYMTEVIAQLRTDRNELLNATWSLLEERNRLLFTRRWLQWFKSRGLTQTLEE